MYTEIGIVLTLSSFLTGFLVLAKLLLAYKVHFSFFKLYRKHSNCQAPVLPFKFGLGQLIETNDSKKTFDNYIRYGKVADKAGIAIGHYGPEPWVIVSHPALVKQLVLASPKKIGRGFGIEVLKSILGGGLVSIMDHEQWKKRRHMLNPLFTLTSIQSMYHLMQRETNRLAQEWSERINANRNNIELCNEFSSLTLGIISACAFGIDYRKPEHQLNHQEVARLWTIVNTNAPIYTAGAGVSEKLMNIFPLKSIRELKGAIVKVRQIGLQMLEERRNDTSNDKQDLMTFLLEAKQQDGSGLSDKEMIDEIIMFLLAGHETTSSLLSFMFYMLATKPEVMKRLKDEIAAKLVDNPSEHVFSFQGVQELTILEQVINETLRLFPPVHVLDKIFLEDGYLVEEDISPVDLQPKKHFIQKGTLASVSVIGLHRNPAIWENPDTFDPDRWAPERIAAMEKKYPLHLCFVPFSAGPRSCIGKQFSIVEAKLIAATILHKFNFVLDPLHHPTGEQMCVETGITTRPEKVQAIVTAQRA